MRKDIKAINEAYEQATAPKQEQSFDYDIDRNTITIFDVPTYNKATDENGAPEPVTYVFQFQSDDVADDLKQRNFKMIANDQEVNPDDYYVDESNAVEEAYKILLRTGEVEMQYHG
jgi:hypothetical protein